MKKMFTVYWDEVQGLVKIKSHLYFYTAKQGGRYVKKSVIDLAIKKFSNEQDLTNEIKTKMQEIVGLIGKKGGEKDG